ncbi:hypothetical protein [Paenibacillus sp. HB172176]|uniref:hypothetical protein n=1 Tax=Paenibacillus sp. HB172176 TaxID=2493690 RepID=UPI001439659C|nr:hypothetical protein [Paenibacillus sp. HB172176]
MNLKQSILIIGVLLAVSLSLNAYSLVQIQKWKQPNSAIETVETASLTALSEELNVAKMQITNHADQIRSLVETEKQTKQDMDEEHEIQSSEITNSISKLTSLIYNLPQVSRKLAFANGLTVEDGQTFVS